MEKSTKVFSDGLIIKKPSERAPEWVKMKLSFKVAEFAAFMSKHENNNGWVDVDVCASKEGDKLYGVLNEFKPEKPKSVKDDSGVSSVPF